MMSSRCNVSLGEVIDSLSDYPYILVGEDETLEEVARKVKGRPGIRSIYVVDEAGGVKGALSLGRFIRVLTSPRCRYRFSTRNLLSCLTADSVRDLMDDHLIFARAEDRVLDVIERMLKKNIKEVPVLDEQGRIVKNVGLLELWDVLEPEECGCG
jgi:CBS domain-containing protein